MRIYYLLFVLLLSSCNNVDIDRDSVFVITKKEQTSDGYYKEMWDLSLRDMGRHKYTIEITTTHHEMIMYSDSDWSIGQHLHLTKN